MKKWLAVLILVLPLPLVALGFFLGLIVWAIWNGMGLAQDFYTTAYRNIAHDENGEDEEDTNEQTS